ncbi:hypothetical protein D9613_008484 [Agrocybe pediades]|uniref:ubiquitinyl hydrolase 1 n=1 Tax=Agrocybe pediades TaxID=84607 RepID=A0A8H4QU03_9AGAR|nr:hypothetical protein D9613_008484 [Agrocybe pediades]
MAKTKGPTPQELYRQRKEREEQERTAYLPPGLINHGNTCFMNSVLQGLIATRLLSDLVHFNPIPVEIQRTAATPIASKRSPQLTNGHNLAGAYEHPWVNTMPIGDVFLTVMYKAWDSQSKRKRESQSPKSILNALGQKYDQYLDFAQQDAHEFLRILLDAMRMEEQDIIKKRQPPQKKRRRTITAADSTDDSDPGLLSFSDMVFGGQLTSILVCQKCKHVSQTYEDFNDISLSIKPEDYYPHKKRDRFKKMVGRLTAFPGSSKDSSSKRPTHIAVPAHQILEMHRSSSVPPSPRTERDVVSNYEEPPITDAPRRRSLDVQSKEAESESAPDSPELPAQPVSVEENAADSSIVVNVTAPEEKHIEFVDQKRERQESGQSALESGSEKEGTQKDKDAWAKIGRRISLSVGLGRSSRGHHDKEKEKEKEKDKKEKERKSRSVDRGGFGGFIKDVVAEVDIGIQKSLSSSSGISSSHSDLHKREKNKLSSEATLRAPSSLNESESVSSTSSKPLPSHPISTSSPKPLQNLLNPSNAQTTPSIFPVQRSKSPKPPKPSHAETEYLRRLLADVATAPSSNPFSIFKPPLLHSHSSHHGSRPAFTSYTPPAASSAANAEKEKTWMGIGIRSLSGIEECLRMFTAVEVLDGENMVGCRRCWKIQNGQLHTSRSDKQEDSDQEDEDEESVPSADTLPTVKVPEDKNVETIVRRNSTTRPPLQAISPASLSLSSGTAVHIPTSISTPTVSFYSQQEEDGSSDTRSVSSLPEPTSPSLTSFESTDGNMSTNTTTTADSSFSSMLDLTSSDVQGSRPAPGGLPIPVISTTAPESPPALSPGFGSTLPSTAAQIDMNRESAYSRLTKNQNGTASPPSVSSDGPSPHPRLTQALYGYPPYSSSSSRSKESLVIPKISRNGLRKRRSLSDSATTTDDNDDSSGEDSDTSVGTSVSGESAFSSRQDASQLQPPMQVNGTSTSEGSSVSSQQQQQQGSALPPVSAPQPLATLPPPPPPKKKTPKPPKPTIMRPAYKRYLIAVPPPVLVIHLKRFQQTSKTPLMSFSHGFKKLDDYVSFPEYLDLMPFLAPRKEDFGLGKKGKVRGVKVSGDKEESEKEREKEKETGKGRREDRCMYRLYAVVMHIGNMLGGHYIAYTALPNQPPDPSVVNRAPPVDNAADTSSASIIPSSTSTTSTSSSTLSADTSTSTNASTSTGTSIDKEKEKEKEKDSEPSRPAGKPAERQWAYISDTVVRLTTLEEVLHAKAYMCMYERC